ncbi:MAG: hypothetical protein EZS28_050602, partial [Streblomastix strix]
PRMFTLNFAVHQFMSGTSLIKKNLKLPPNKICCFLMDRSPGREEDSRGRF